MPSSEATLPWSNIRSISSADNASSKVSGYRSMICRTTSICSSCIRAVSAGAVSPGIHTDQNCAPTNPWRSLGISVSKAFSRSSRNAVTSPPFSSRINQGRSLCPSINGVDCKISIACCNAASENCSSLSVSAPDTKIGHRHKAAPTIGLSTIAFFTVS